MIRAVEKDSVVSRRPKGARKKQLVTDLAMACVEVHSRRFS